MKLTNETMLIGAAALIGFIMLKKRGGTARTSSSSAGGGTQEISQPNGAAWQNGWRYFNDGTAIDPQGNYYRAGVLVYRAKG